MTIREPGAVVSVGYVVGICIKVGLDVVAGGYGRSSHPAGRRVDDGVADE